MGFFSFIGDCISVAVSVVGSAVSAIGGALGALAGAVLKVASPYLSTLITVVEVVSQLLGILNPEESSGELGDKAMRAEKQAEDFDTTQEYIAYLREEVDFDKEAFEKLSDEEKLARSAIGTAISMKAINEKKGVDISLDTWTSMAKLYDKELLNKDNLDSFLDEFKENQTELNGYVNKEIKGVKGVEFSEKLAQAYQKLEPELSVEEIDDRVLRSKIGD